MCYTYINSYNYYFFNAHGDVTQRVNSDGIVLKSYKYDIFGNIINPATVGDPNDPIYVDQSPFGYAGEYLDKENGEIYLRARYYSSEQGRFVTEDPSKYSSNWYCYCDNNPIKYVDPSGLRPFIPPTPSDSGGSRPRDEEDTSNTGSSGNTSNTGNTGSSSAENIPARKPEPIPSFDDGRGGSVDVTPPKPPTPDVKENSSTKEDALYVEETTEFTDEFLASVLEDVVITSYEAASTGLITAASHTTFKSITKSLISKTNKAFIGVGFIVDFGMQIESGKQLGESLIYAAIHSLIAYGVMALCMAYINPVIIGTFIAIVLSAVINTAIDEFIFER